MSICLYRAARGVKIDFVICAALGRVAFLFPFPPRRTKNHAGKEKKKWLGVRGSARAVCFSVWFFYPFGATKGRTYMWAKPTLSNRAPYGVLRHISTEANEGDKGATLVARSGDFFCAGVSWMQRIHAGAKKILLRSLAPCQRDTLLCGGFVKNPLTFHVAMWRFGCTKGNRSDVEGDFESAAVRQIVSDLSRRKGKNLLVLIP